MDLAESLEVMLMEGPGREAALAWASLAQRFLASSVLARAGALPAEGILASIASLILQTQAGVLA